MGEIRNKWAHFSKMSTREGHRSIETIDQICKVVFLNTERLQKTATPKQSAIGSVLPQQSKFQSDFQNPPTFEDEEAFYYEENNWNNYEGEDEQQTPNCTNVGAISKKDTALQQQKLFDDSTFENFKRDCLKAFKDLRNIQNFMVKLRNHEISSEEKEKQMKMDIEDDN